MSASAKFAPWVVAFFTVYGLSYYHRNVNAPETSYWPEKTFMQLLSVMSGYNKEASFSRSVYNTVACSDLSTSPLG